MTDLLNEEGKQLPYLILFRMIKSSEPSSYSQWNEEIKRISSKTRLVVTGSCADGFKSEMPCVSASLADGQQEVLL